MTHPHIHIIGAGKLGRTLSVLLTTREISHTLHMRDFPSTLSGLIYCCVPEDAIQSVAEQLVLDQHSILLHASGSLGLEILNPHTHRIGCLHPIQSFPGPEISIPTIIPATFQCHPEEYEYLWPTIQWFAELVGFELYHYTGSRLNYHTAAVISGNFATILLHQAASLLVKEGMSLKDACQLLQPLAITSIANGHKGSLSDVLTGPIARQQDALIQTQATNLSFDKDLQDLYHLMVKIAAKSRGNSSD